MSIKCPECGWIFRNEAGLRAHRASRHGRTEPAAGNSATPTTVGAPKGWYANPDGPGERYWDGERWSQNTQGTEPEGPSGLRLALSYALAVLIPIVGAVLGVLLLVRRSVGHGIAVIAISAAMLVLVLVIDPPSGSGGGDETSVEDRVSRITDRAMTCVRHHNYRHINECLK